MIFVTVGSAPQDFSRLVKAMDELAAGSAEEMVIQRGFCSYLPKHAKSFDFVPYDKAMELYEKARIVISHVSAGPIIYARKFNKPLVVMPRQGVLREHIDNHQMETAKAIESRIDMVEVVYDEEQIGPAIKRANVKADSKKVYAPAMDLDKLTKTIADFLEAMEGKLKKWKG